jgi:hypothetical protein
VECSHECGVQVNRIVHKATSQPSGVLDSKPCRRKLHTYMAAILAEGGGRTSSSTFMRKAILVGYIQYDGLRETVIAKSAILGTISDAQMLAQDKPQEGSRITGTGWRLFDIGERSRNREAVTPTTRKPK